MVSPDKSVDSLFNVSTIAATPNPQQLVWLAMHQDYSAKQVIRSTVPTEEKAGQIVVERLLKGGRGHFGCFEHPSISVSCGYINHGTMQQLRTHRMGITFDVQSFRYTSSELMDVAGDYTGIERVIYFRPEGNYTDRQGHHYTYTSMQREMDMAIARQAINAYADKVLNQGMSEEHCRSMLPFDYRQHFVMSVNARSLMHLLDMRAKKDAQLECQWFSKLLLQEFTTWMPAVAEWYKSVRLGKGTLAP